ncbi:MAG: cytochrome-c3 hydrogenase subunit gamma [Thermoplasmata archaeon]|nr:MAG: cytochrome-c3 hydrogenase subunit gamma [Thermoplasmata archaeon]
MGDNLKNTYLGAPARVLEVENLTSIEKLYTLRFLDNDINNKFNFIPGQFVMFNVPGIGEFPVSICSSPTRTGYLQLCIRRAGRVTKYVHENIVEGSIVYIRGPYGNGFPLEEMKNSPIVLVAGGLGMAPLRSILLYHLDTQHFSDLYLFYGVRNYELMLFKREIRTLLRGYYNVHVYLSFEDIDRGARELIRLYRKSIVRGMVTDALEVLRGSVPFEESYAVMCGPPVMYKFVVKKLLDLKVRPDRIYMTLERRMKCGIGKCGHCIVGTSTSIKYVCLDGPVFTYWDVLSTKGLIE